MVEFAFVLLAGWFAAFVYVTGDAVTAAYVASWAALFILGVSWTRRERAGERPAAIGPLAANTASNIWLSLLGAAAPFSVVCWLLFAR